jgi:hypothetical protein
MPLGRHARLVFTALSPLIVGCGDAALPGDLFQISAKGLEDGCTGGNANLSENFEYRVVFDGNNVEIAVGEDVFASGRADGCLISYESVVWQEDRNGKSVNWQILGSATVDVNGSCETGSESDWIGTESFQIVNSEDESLTPGCSYLTELTGKHKKSD